MDWNRVIEVNREALTRIVAQLVAMVGLAGHLLPRPVQRSVLAVLLPAESAVRRLIVIAARGVVLAPAPVRAMPKGLVIKPTGEARGPAFSLFDARKTFAYGDGDAPAARFLPRIRVIDFPPPFAPLFLPQPQTLPADDGESAPPQRLHRRIAALKMALETLPRQARRMARWCARRAAVANPKFTSPLRQGPPPGHRARPREPVDLILKECHALAWETLRANTS